jgi:COP9 signalosome complex subunit 6
VIASLSSQRNALSMLSSRVSQITAYLTAVSEGKAKKDDETLRQIQALVSGLKGQVGGGQLEKEFMTVSNT